MRAESGQALEMAFQALYSLEFSPVRNESELKQAFLTRPGFGDNEPAGEDPGLQIPCASLEDEPCRSAWAMVLGVWGNSTALDKALSRLSEHWRIDRVGKVELTLLRLGLYEIYLGQQPAQGVIRKIGKIADNFGISDGRRFILGILEKASRAPHAVTLKNQGS